MRTLLAVAALLLLATNGRAITLEERLQNAAAQGNVKELRRAIADGAAIDGALTYDRVTPLMTAAMNGKPSAVKALLKAKADVGLRDSSGADALLYCGAPRAKSKDEGDLAKAAKLLLDAGADANQPDRQGWRPLMAAIEAGNKKLVAALLAAGADPRAKNAEGQTAMLLAKAKGQKEVVDMLREAGAH